jgi:hypothetical protein
MEQKIIEKVSRFLELSVQFSKNEENVFGKNEDSYNFRVSYTGQIFDFSNKLTIEGRELYIENGVVKAKDNKPLTRADTILAEANIKAKLSNKFDEYQKLQSELSTYFEALTNITK